MRLSSARTSLSALEFAISPEALFPYAFVRLRDGAPAVGYLGASIGNAKSAHRPWWDVAHLLDWEMAPRNARPPPPARLIWIRMQRAPPRRCLRGGI